ncbi:DUF502 domain-containing protein [Bordetella sp. 02P26C-1]|nr:DUF502 domain-containing protein [Bordetella sp. 02P26C-1]
MARLSRYFFLGLITALPIVLTLYVLFIFLAWTERAALAFLGPFIGGFYIPGMGLALGVLGILLIGYLVSKERVQRIFYFLEMPFTNIPVVKSIYSSLKSFADYFTPNAKSDTQHVVVLRIPGQPLELVGLITRRNTEGLPEGFMQGERVAVYLPMGYMIGGYTVFVPAEWVQPIDMSVEEAMRASLIAWMARAPGEPYTPPPAPAPSPEPTETAAPASSPDTTETPTPAPAPVSISTSAAAAPSASVSAAAPVSTSAPATGEPADGHKPL